MELRKWNKVVGVMSGTSLDGLDIALCSFRKTSEAIEYRLHVAETIAYPKEWIEILQSLDLLSGRELWHEHTRYGHYIGKQINAFLSRNKETAPLIASHGHTVFHRPDLGYTLQIGCGASISAETGIPVVCDFRTGDVAKGGQGAPLVPIGDELLFGEYAACINLGGFGNISFGTDQGRIAFDICPVNKALNPLMNIYGLNYDPEGSYARKGHLISNILTELNSLEYYSLKGPRSLGQEWLDRSFSHIIDRYKEKPEDLLNTLSEHIAIQISRALEDAPDGQVLITGGGAKNSYLIERIRHHCKHRIHIPEADLVDFKEALIFALMGLLRVNGQINCLATVTGANSDGIGGAVYLP